MLNGKRYRENTFLLNEFSLSALFVGWKEIFNTSQNRGQNRTASRLFSINKEILHLSNKQKYQSVSPVRCC